MRMGSSIALWTGSAFCATLTLAAIVLTSRGVAESGTDAALFMTARLSFLLFWLAYTGSALTAIFGQIFLPLKKRAREFGLAFASAHLVHLGLVGWLCIIGAAPSVSVFVVFGAAAIWVYLLALFSIDQLRQTLGPTGWWILQVVGMNYILYAFAIDFIKPSLNGGFRHTVEYLPFVILAIAALTLRLGAVALRLEWPRRGSSHRAG
jgi:hypothetical protein